MQHLFQADLNLLMYFGDESPSKPFQSGKLYLVYVYVYIYIRFRLKGSRVFSWVLSILTLGEVGRAWLVDSSLGATFLA